MKKILIVEDDKDMQEVYRSFFEDEKEKYEIAVMDDATDALTVLKDGGYDLVVLDIIMEPMTGDSFFVYAKDDIKTMNIPIIIVSVLSQDIMTNLNHIGKFEYLQKPISKEQLINKIEDLI
ncbi:MAG: response regulator [Pseudomonadota bacterium]